MCDMIGVFVVLLGIFWIGYCFGYMDGKTKSEEGNK